MPSTHRLTVYAPGSTVRGSITYIKVLGPGHAELHMLTSGWLAMGTYQAEYTTEKQTAGGTFAVLEYENGVGDNWLFKGVFTKK